MSPGGGLIPAPMSLPSSRRHQKSMPISPVPEDENSSSSTTSSSGNSPVVLLNVNMGEETSVLPPNLRFIFNFGISSHSRYGYNTDIRVYITLLCH